MKTLLLGILICATVSAQAAAPFKSTFVGVKASEVEKNIKYYPALGMGPRTLNFYLGDGFIMSAGAFDASSIADVRVHFGINQQEFDRRYRINRLDDYRPKELSVISQYGLEIFYVTWEKANGTPWEVWVNLTDADFDQKWKELVTDKGYRVSRHVSYSKNDGRRHSVIFVKDNKAFLFYSGQTKAQFLALANDLATKGFFPTELSIHEIGVGVFYSAVWTKENPNTITSVNMTRESFNRKTETYQLQGYRLQKIVGFQRGTRFAAIWVK